MAATTDATEVVYELEGTLLEACSCGVLCPCWIGEDPDGGACDAFNAYHFDSGTIRGIDVSGLNFVRVVHIPGNVLTPASWKQVVFIDERASDDQRQAILDAYDGKLGGPLADLAGLIGETLGVERASDHPRGPRRQGQAHDRRRGAFRDAPVHRPRRDDDHTARLAVLHRSPAPPPTSRWPTARRAAAPVRNAVVAGEPQRDPGRLSDPAHGMSATATTTTGGRVPPTVVGAIVIAWALAVGAEISGRGTALHHDALIEGELPYALALVLFLVAWQAMIAAMMVPSTLPLLRLFAAAATGQPRPRAAIAAFLAGYALVWTAFGWLAFVGDTMVHATVDRTPWLQQHDWLIAGGTLALAGAFQFSALKDRCLRCAATRRLPAAPLRTRTSRGACARTPARPLLPRCCWALMLLMFAAGVANLWWMAGLTALMVYEKTGAGGRRAVPVAGIALLACAALVLAHPHWLPALLGGSH
jgi:predicted metal-binding membrane protein